jgi:hypothetical protein
MPQISIQISNTWQLSLLFNRKNYFLNKLSEHKNLNETISHSKFQYILSFSVCEVGFKGANQTKVVPSLFGLLVFCMHLGNEPIRGSS